MEIKDNNLNKETYFSKEDHNIDKNEILGEINETLSKDDKIHSMEISFNKEYQERLLTDITDKKVNSINELPDKEKQEYENKIKDYYKDSIDDFNKGKTDGNKIEFYGKISHDQGHSRETKLNVIFVDKSNTRLDQDKLKDTINTKFNKELNIESTTKFEANNDFALNKIIYETDKIPLDSKNNEQLDKLRDLLNDKAPGKQEDHIRVYSKLDEKEKEQYLNKMESARMNRDYLDVLKDDDSLEFDLSKGLPDNDTISYDDFKKDWKEEFEKENQIKKDLNDIGYSY